MAKCKRLTLKGLPCKLKPLANGYCRAHQDPFTPDITPETSETQPNSEIQTAVLTPETRVLKHWKPPIRPKSYLPKCSIGKGVYRPKPNREIQTAVLIPVLRYRMNPRCPECGAHPTVCKLRRKNYGLFRCRICGHRFEVKK